MFEYIYEGTRHTDTSADYMSKLGIADEAIDSILQQRDFELSRNRQLRSDAYKRESDPLYIEWQFELESSNPASDDYKKKWMSKALEIKARYPLPEDLA
ncbi:hypothetical protein PL84_03805 [Vibrio anguillarum]|uniref:hypothetical protein n=1 Tax=Vibrio anguillarum TaxID=55601 RepID=UPI00097E187A|nr:hypothetical protein [Vibrio anguillarum]MBT2909707.1 hypothetical protein [Vibrio anguillarum]MBT2942442.1 hypothetical protein [Vibrio anguillarum]MBT2950734.1 hypothetical protein [Vibrio anguillarum]